MLKFQKFCQRESLADVAHIILDMSRRNQRCLLYKARKGFRLYRKKYPAMEDND